MMRITITILSLVIIFTTLLLIFENPERTRMRGLEETLQQDSRDFGNEKWLSRLKNLAEQEKVLPMNSEFYSPMKQEEWVKQYISEHMAELSKSEDKTYEFGNDYTIGNVGLLYMLFKHLYRVFHLLLYRSLKEGITLQASGLDILGPWHLLLIISD